MAIPKILYLDIETLPIKVFVWGLGKQYVTIDQIESDWELASWAAIWNDDPEKKVMYEDRRNHKSEKALLKKIHSLLNEADIVVTQNGVRFDTKKLNAKFIEHGFNPPSSYNQIDTYKIGKKFFGFTSHKLAYMCKKLNLKYKKSSHKRFPGLQLWKECIKGNLSAWKEMEHYNKYDIFSLRELHQKMQSWDSSINYNIYNDDLNIKCNCGSSHFQRRGFSFTKTGKFQRFQCLDCGSWSRSNQNLLSKEKRQSLRK